MINILSVLMHRGTSLNFLVLAVVGHYKMTHAYV